MSNTDCHSLIPTDLALCQQGHHAITTRYGPCGIITAVVRLCYSPSKVLLLTWSRFCSLSVFWLCCKPNLDPYEHGEYSDHQKIAWMSKSAVLDAVRLFDVFNPWHGFLQRCHNSRQVEPSNHGFGGLNCYTSWSILTSECIPVFIRMDFHHWSFDCVVVISIYNHTLEIKLALQM